MAGELTITAADVRPVKIIEQVTAPASVDLDAGAWVKLDAAGKIAKADGAAAANSRRAGILITSAKANMPATFVRKGKVYLGAALDAVNLAAPIYASDTAGLIATAAGAGNVLAGIVEPVHADPTSPIKVLAIDN